MRRWWLVVATSFSIHGANRNNLSEDAETSMIVRTQQCTKCLRDVQFKHGQHALESKADGEEEPHDTTRHDAPSVSCLLFGVDPIQSRWKHSTLYLVLPFPAVVISPVTGGLKHGKYCRLGLYPIAHKSLVRLEGDCHLPRMTGRRMFSLSGASVLWLLLFGDKSLPRD